MSNNPFDPMGISKPDLLATRGSSLSQQLQAITAKSKTSPVEQAEKAATEFESLLVNQMIKSMWQSVPKSGLLSGGYEEEMYQEMLQQEVSGHIAKYQSFGIKDMVMRELKEKNKGGD